MIGLKGPGEKGEEGKAAEGARRVRGVKGGSHGLEDQLISDRVRQAQVGPGRTRPQARGA